jgi:hypothetical protein
MVQESSFKPYSSLSLSLVESFSKRAHTFGVEYEETPTRASMCSLPSSDNP